MASNDFLTFAGDPAANVLDQAGYAALTARLLGFSTGVASSQQLNKTWRQSAVIASMIGQFIVDESAQDAIDDGTTATLLARFKVGVGNAAIGAIGTGFLPLTGGTLTGSLTVNAANAVTVNAPPGQGALVSLGCAAAQIAGVFGKTGNTNRWGLALTDSTPETGGNAGSNFALWRYTDAGTYIDSPINISRQTGVVNFAKPFTVAGSPLSLAYLPLAGGSLTGQLSVAGGGVSYSALGTYAHAMAFGWDGSVRAYVDGTFIGQLATLASNDGRYVPLTGGTITGSLTVNGNCAVLGSVTAAWLHSTGDVQVDGNLWGNGAVTAGYLHSTGNANVDGALQVNGNANAGSISTGYLRNAGTTELGNLYIDGAIVGNNSGVLYLNNQISCNSSLWAAGNITAHGILYADNAVQAPWMHSTGNLSADGAVYAVGDVQAGNGGVRLSSNGIRFDGVQDGNHLFNMRWASGTFLLGVDNAVWQQVVTSDSSANTLRVINYAGRWAIQIQQGGNTFACFVDAIN